MQIPLFSFLKSRFSSTAELPMNNRVVTSNMLTTEAPGLSVRYFIDTPDKGATWSWGTETYNSAKNERSINHASPYEPTSPAIILNFLAGKELEYIHRRAGYTDRNNDSQSPTDLKSKKERLLNATQETADESHGNPDHIFKAVRDFGDFTPTQDTANLLALRRLLNDVGYLQINKPEEETTLKQTITHAP